MMRSRGLIGGLLGAAAMLVAAPAALGADDTNLAKRGSVPDGLECIHNGSGAKACFQPRGDTFWIKDDDSDGRSAIIVWEQYLGPGEYRKGWCRNMLGGGSWGYCNKELEELSQIEFWAVEYDADTKQWSEWSAGEIEIT
jgi:hypothetical protein